ASREGPGDAKLIRIGRSDLGELAVAAVRVVAPGKEPFAGVLVRGGGSDASADNGRSGPGVGARRAGADRECDRGDEESANEHETSGVGTNGPAATCVLPGFCDRPG